MIYDITSRIPSYFDSAARVRVGDIGSAQDNVNQQEAETSVGAQLRLAGQAETLPMDRVSLGIEGRSVALEDYSYLRMRRGVSMYAEEVEPTDTSQQ